MRYEPEGDLEFQLDNLLNGGLTLEDNLDGSVLEETLDAGENEITHSLGFVPTGYILLYRSKKEEVWGTRVSDWTTAKLFLESSVANQRVRLFVL